MGFEHTIPVVERAKTLHAVDHTVTDWQRLVLSTTEIYFEGLSIVFAVWVEYIVGNFRQNFRLNNYYYYVIFYGI
jgi:hypothetical protein